MSTEGPRHSPSGVMMALGSSVPEVLAIVQTVARVTTEQLIARAGSAPEVIAGWVAQELRKQLASAYLAVKNDGEREGMARSREVIDALAVGIGHALSELEQPQPDLNAIARALRIAASALPTNK